MIIKNAMKTTKIVILFITLLASNMISCVNEDTFTIPQTGEEENTSLQKILDSIATSADWNEITVSELKDQYASGTDPIQINSNLVVGSNIRLGHTVQLVK